MRRAVIVGHTGQDGRILWEQLASRGFSLVGISRREVRAPASEWNGLVDVADARAVSGLVRSFRPEQIYYLAAHHHSSQGRAADEAALWEASWTVHVQGFRHVLSAVRDCQPQARVFYASSSRIFGEAEASPQNESTPLRPRCIYGLTKAMAMTLADYYRRRHGLFVSCGILFNHESPWRGREFVSQRIANGLVELKKGRLMSLQIGDFEARVDWGYAPDYTRAMQLILDVDAPDDFVIASGETHSVREMVEIGAEVLDLDWTGRVVESAKILQRKPQHLCGDPSRLRRVTGWRPSMSFRQLVTLMVDAAQAVG